MTTQSFSDFLTDYNLLCDLKADSELWNEALSYKADIQKNHIFFKNYFDSINSFDYVAYKRLIGSIVPLNNSMLIIGYPKPTERESSLRECLRVHYQCETYIGFIVEIILFEELQPTERVYKNNKLDTVKKADLLLNGNFYQIKNYSFVLSPNITSLIDYYKSHNKRLLFLFYTIEKENIYFLTIGGNAYLHIDKINGFTFATQTEKAPLSDFISLLKGA